MPCKTVAIAHTIGIDTGKNTLHMIGLDKKGTIVVREKVSRTRIAARLVNVPQCLIGIEAGMASHHVAVSYLPSVMRSNRCRRPMPGHSAKDTRTTFGMRMRSPKLSSALLPAASR